MNHADISKYIFIEDEDLKGDVALVFGTWNAWKSSTEKAAELYKNEFVSKIVVSGGLNKQSGLIEGNHMTEKLLNLGIPAQDVLIEDKASNTLENVTLSLQLIDKKLGLKNIKTIVAVVKNYHARRSLMTLKKHAPAHIKLKSAAYISDYCPFTKDTWMHTETGKENVMLEVEKIRKYLEKGDLAEL